MVTAFEAPGSFLYVRATNPCNSQLHAKTLKIWDARKLIAQKQVCETLQHLLWAFATKTPSVHVLPDSLFQPWVDIRIAALFGLSVQIVEKKLLQLQPFPIYLLSTRHLTQLLWRPLRFCNHLWKLFVQMKHLVASLGQHRPGQRSIAVKCRHRSHIRWLQEHHLRAPTTRHVRNINFICGSNQQRTSATPPPKTPTLVIYTRTSFEFRTDP